MEKNEDEDESDEEMEKEDEETDDEGDWLCDDKKKILFPSLTKCYGSEEKAMKLFQTKC